MKTSPTEKGNVKTSKFIHGGFVKGLVDVQNNISCIDSSWTYESAFAAEHAFAHFALYIVGQSPADEQAQFTEAEAGKIGGAAGSCAGTALDANPERGLIFLDERSHAPIHFIIVDLVIVAYAISELIHERGLYP